MLACLLASSVAYAPLSTPLLHHSVAPRASVSAVAWAEIPANIREKSSRAKYRLRKRLGLVTPEEEVKPLEDTSLATAWGVGLAALGLNIAIFDGGQTMAAGVAAVGASAAAAEDAGLLGDGARAVGNATRAAVSLASDLDEQFDLGWTLRAVNELALERLTGRVPELKAVVDTINPPPKPKSLRERLAQRVEAKRARLVSRVEAKRDRFVTRVDAKREAVTSRVVATRESLEAALDTAVVQRVQGVAEAARSVRLPTVDVALPAATPRPKALVLSSSFLVAAILVLGGGVSPASITTGASTAVAVAGDVVVYSGAMLKLGAARLLLWMTAPLVALA